MPPMSLDQIQQAIEKFPGDIYAAANHLKLTPTMFMQAVRRHERVTEHGVSYIIPLRQYPYDIGKPELVKFVISVCRTDDNGWPLRDREKIEAGRLAHDQGKSDMFQGRFSGWKILYCKPRRKRDLKRRPWFTAETIDATVGGA